MVAPCSLLEEDFLVWNPYFHEILKSLQIVAFNDIFTLMTCTNLWKPPYSKCHQVSPDPYIHEICKSLQIINFPEQLVFHLEFRQIEECCDSVDGGSFTRGLVKRQTDDRSEHIVFVVLFTLRFKGAWWEEEQIQLKITIHQVKPFPSFRKYFNIGEGKIENLFIYPGCNNWPFGPLRYIPGGTCIYKTTVKDYVMN